MYRKSIIAVLFTCLLSLTPILGAAEEKAELPKIGDTVEDIGTFIDMADEERLQLYIEDLKIIAYVVDKDNVIVENEIDSILFTASNIGARSSNYRTILHPDDTGRMTGTQNLYPPYQFRATVIIRFTEGEPSTSPNVPLNLTRNLSE